MLKTVKINNQEIKLRVSAATPIFYRAQFGRDFVADMVGLEATSKALDSGDYEHVRFETLYRLIWIAAYSADKTIPDMETWLDSFDEMPLETIMPEVVEMVGGLFKATKKSKAPVKRSK